MTVRIREFTDDDWAAVQPIWREVIEAGETYCADPAMSDEDARAYWLSDQHTVVALVGDEVVGSAHCGPNRTAQGSHIGTASFIVSASARGRGVGRALGGYVVGWLLASGFRGIQFNAVVSSNTAAVSLWESLGFVVVGTVPGAFQRPSGECVGLQVMFRELP